MNAFCNQYLNLVPWIVDAFLILALVIAVLSAGVGLVKAWQTPPPPPPPAPPKTQEEAAIQAQIPVTAPLIDALKGLLESIAKAPVWFAMFLAGAFLFWLAGQQYQDVCKPPAPPAPAPRVVAPVARPAAGNPPAQANIQAAAPGH